MIDELDIKILKSICNDKVSALTFAFRYDSTIFDEDSQHFAKMVLDYIKTFRAPPTKRTLLDRHKNNVHLTELIEKTWTEIDAFEYDTNEYSYDLGVLKKRFQVRAVDFIRAKAAEDDPDSPQNPEEYFNKLSLEINRVTSLDLERTHTQKPVADYVDEFKEQYEAYRETPESTIEIKTGYSMIDSVYGGASPGELIMIGGETAAGKAVAIDTPIATPNGWTTIGDIKPGDIVFSDDGLPCNVLAVSGIMYGHDCYEIVFSDGAKIIADKGHLWETYTRADRCAIYKRTESFRTHRRHIRKLRGKGLRPYLVERNKIIKPACQPPPERRTYTTEEISKTVTVRQYKNHSVKTCKPLQLPEKDLPIDPYLLGLWLGDGTSNDGGYTTSDSELVNAFELGGYIVTKYKTKYGYYIRCFMQKLQQLGLIKNKQIPPVYLRASFEQRLAMVQGLMDTDGFCCPHYGGCEFDTTSIALRDGMLELLRGIGVTARYTQKFGTVNGVKKKMSYRIEFRTTHPVFRLARKKIRQSFVESRNANHRMIVSVTKVDSVPVQCIQVDSTSNMFLCGKEMIPTHNSMLLNNAAKQMWLQGNSIDNNEINCKGYSVLYFSLEMPYQDCFIRFLASLANVPQRSLSKSTLTLEEEERVQKAYNFMKKYQENGYYFDIVDVPRNLTIEEVELRYHDAMLRYRPEIVVVDYMGLMHSNALAKEQDWLKMGGIAASLHEFARAYDCVVITAAQLTDLKRGSTGSQEESRRVGVHRWGRSSLIMHNVNLGIQIETRQNEKSFPDLKIHVVKNRKGPLGDGNLIKNFANASLVDVPYDQRDMPGDVSSSIPDLIKSIQDLKNKANENS